MAKRFSIVGGSLRCVDTITGDILFSEPSRDIWYLEQKLQQGVIQLYDCNTSLNSEGMFDIIFLADAQDSSGTPFTESTFRTFVFNSLGFDSLEPISTFATRVISLSGGFLVNNPCI